MLENLTRDQLLTILQAIIDRYTSNIEFEKNLRANAKDEMFSYSYRTKGYIENLDAYRFYDGMVETMENTLEYIQTLIEKTSN